MRKKEWKFLITFPTTTAAMKMENRAKEAALPGRLIPMPLAVSDGCGLAFCTDLAEKEKAETFLEQQQLAFSRVLEVLI